VCKYVCMSVCVGGIDMWECGCVWVGRYVCLRVCGGVLGLMSGRV
jgi:hypothetical protein